MRAVDDALELVLTRAGHELNDRIVEIALGREKLLLSGFSKKEADLMI